MTSEPLDVPDAAAALRVPGRDRRPGPAALERLHEASGRRGRRGARLRDVRPAAVKAPTRTVRGSTRCASEGQPSWRRRGANWQPRSAVRRVRTNWPRSSGFRANSSSLHRVPPRLLLVQPGQRRAADARQRQPDGEGRRDDRDRRRQRQRQDDAARPPAAVLRPRLAAPF